MNQTLYYQALDLDARLMRLLYHGTPDEQRKARRLVVKSWRRVLRRQIPRSS